VQSEVLERKIIMPTIKYLVEVEAPDHITEDNIRGVFDFIHCNVLSVTRATELRTGADGAVAEESPKNLRTEDSDAGAMGDAG
jgi:hypothetical protein